MKTGVFGIVCTVYIENKLLIFCVVLYDEKYCSTSWLSYDHFVNTYTLNASNASNKYPQRNVGKVYSIIE